MICTKTTVFGLYKAYSKKILVAFLAIALTFFAWANLIFQVNVNANAATVEGVKDQVEGKVKQDIGTVQRNLGKATGQTEGALKQAKGKVKQDIGTTKNKLDNAGDKVEDTSESLIDSVKDFFD